MAVFSSPLSQENRLQIARASFSSSAITGARSLAISPVASPTQLQQDPETLQLLEDNQSSLVSISSGIYGVRQSIDGLNQSLDTVVNAIYSSVTLEQNKENQRLQQERVLAEDALRDENEELLERKIQNASSDAIQPIAQQTQRSLNSLMGLFNPLFLGWLGFGAIQNIQSLLGNNKERFVKIGDAVENSFKFITSGLNSIKDGLTGFVGKVTSMTEDVTKVVTQGLFKGLFGGLKGPGNAADDAGKGVASAADDAGKGVASAADDAGKGVASAADDVGKGLRGMGSTLLRGASGLASAAFGGLEFMERKEEGQTTTQAAAGAGGSVVGAEVGALTGARVGSLFGPLGTIGGAVLGGAGGWMLGGGMADIMTGVSDKKEQAQQQSQPKPKAPEIKQQTPPAAPPKPTEKPQALVQPQTPILTPEQIQINEKKAEEVTAPTANFNVNFGDQISNYVTKMSGDTSANSMENVADTMKSSFTNNLINNPAISFSPFDFSPKEENEVSYNRPSPVAPVKKNISISESVGPLPEPPPNVIVAPLKSQQRTMINPPGSSGVANDVPNISSSNPDNFYISYSLTQYNVVV